MRKLYLIVILAFGFTAFSVSTASGQANNKAYVYKMVPKAGMSSAVEAALKAHAAWRTEHGDTWNWAIYQEVVGQGLGTFYARSGNHTFADFDEYALSGATAQFNETVLPHLASLSNTITAEDTTVVNLPLDVDYKYFNIAVYNLKVGGQRDFFAAANKFHAAIKEHNSPLYYVFAHTILGGDGTGEVVGVFPSSNWAGFEDPDPSINEIMIDMYGEEETMKIVEQFEGSFRSSSSAVLLFRPDLSVMGN